MSSRCHESRLPRTAARRLIASCALLALAGVTQAGVPLRVCADPDNAPFSRADGSGFENRLAQLLADDLHRPLQYAWLPDRRGFVRKTLGAQLCDVIMGVPVGFGPVATTHAYYRSGYVFVQRADTRPVLDFEDPRLAQLRIGVQLVGNDAAETPPAHVLARRGIVGNVAGYMVGSAGPPAARMIDDVASGALDIAILWGPQAGPLVAQSHRGLRLDFAPAPPDAGQPFDFSIAMGTRAADDVLHAQLEGFLARRQTDIERVLDEFSVPRLALGSAP